MFYFWVSSTTFMIRTGIWVCGIVGVLLFFNENVYAQILQGGRPLDIAFGEKSGKEAIWYKTPSVNQLKKEDASFDFRKELSNKPLKYAYPFYVSLSTMNSGEWTVADNYRIWKLGIESEGAFSIGLLFGKYKLPSGAKLFIFNEARTDVIGAFTELNNKESGGLSVMPVAGDKIFIQYEELIDSDFEGELEISRISHDYVGIKSTDPRRPIQLAGECNININCEIAEDYINAKNSICRIYIPKTKYDELCTGVLVNNTSHDGKPYVLTAAHCIESDIQAQNSLFLFNYESPYCGSIDGDNTHSLEGSTLKARFDSLDFTLVELSVAPPNYYRPYYAGWDASEEVPASTHAVHHPQGDIKKIAFDEDSPLTSDFNGNYISSAFWNVVRWEYGVTEDGSSGCPLFNDQSQIIGTLTGGIATCNDPEDDYFEKLKESWSYKNIPEKQLKYWLDPGNTGEMKIDGYDPYSGELKCGVFTNFTVRDTTRIDRVNDNIPSQGYWTGSNTEGYFEFAEKFSGLTSCEINGVSLGLARSYVADSDVDVYISVKVYEGEDNPETLVYSQDFPLNQMVEDAMNYLAFDEAITTIGDFFISCSISQLNEADTLVIYNAERLLASNTFFLKDNSGWEKYNIAKGSSTGTALLMEVVACNINGEIVNEYVTDDILTVFPNPVSNGSVLNVYSSAEIEKPEQAKIYNLLGKEIPFQLLSKAEKSFKLQLSNSSAGIYLLQLEINGKKYTGKILLVP